MAKLKEMGCYIRGMSGLVERDGLLYLEGWVA